MARKQNLLSLLQSQSNLWRATESTQLNMDEVFTRHVRHNTRVTKAFTTHQRVPDFMPDTQKIGDRFSITDLTSFYLKNSQK